jgi:glycerol kinase
VAEAGEDLMIGTVESWLVYRLTGGLHVTDATNASRTGLMNIGTGQWDQALLELWRCAAGALPRIIDCAGEIGWTTADLFGAPILIAGLAGRPAGGEHRPGLPRAGDTKATYGRALHPHQHGREQRRSDHRLLSTSPGSSPASATTHWKDRCSSPAV